MLNNKMCKFKSTALQWLNVCAVKISYISYLKTFFEAFQVRYKFPCQTSLLVLPIVSPIKFNINAETSITTNSQNGNSRKKDSQKTLNVNLKKTVANPFNQRH